MDMAGRAISSGTGPMVSAASDVAQMGDPEQAQQIVEQIQSAMGQTQ